MTSNKRGAALSLLVVLLIALVTCASWAANELVETRGPFAIASNAGRIALGVGDEVLLTNDEGEVLSVASSARGESWRFGDVASLSFDEAGRLYVADHARRARLSARGGASGPSSAPGHLAVQRERVAGSVAAFSIFNAWWQARRRVRLITPPGAS